MENLRNMRNSVQNTVTQEEVLLELMPRPGTPINERGHSTESTMNGYIRNYIKRAKSEATLEAPDNNEAGMHLAVLEALYEAHRGGGKEGAVKAWGTILNIFPELQMLENPDRLIYANDLKTLTVPEYLHPDYPIYERGMNVLVGQSGAGKSFVALDIASKVACNGKTVIYIAAEGLHGYSARWEAWKKHNADDTDHLIFYSESVDMMDQSAVVQFIAEVSAHKPQLIVIDTLARCMVSGDENSTRDMGQWIANVDHVMRQLNCGVLIIHHTGKDGSMRGNTALKGACDSVITLSKEDSIIRLSNRFDHGGKNKHREEAPPHNLQLLPVDVSWDGNTYQSAVIIESDMVIQTKDSPLTANQKAILEALDAFEYGLSASQIEDATTLPKRTIYNNLKKLKQLDMLAQSDSGNYTITAIGQMAL